MHSSQGQIYSPLFRHCTQALNGYIAYFSLTAEKNMICLGFMQEPTSARPARGLKAALLCLVPLYCTQESIFVEL